MHGFTDEVQVLRVFWTDIGGKHYLLARGDVAYVSDECVHRVLVELVQQHGGRIRGVHRLPAVCECHRDTAVITDTCHVCSQNGINTQPGST